ncbi:DUF6663 family protein [Halorubrum vacuolatum]|uniref:Uncharacterized protein n=1 Tax=Halorubrum vacuolatum TaxID=63740 RepID=A0A238VM57_HALVU|nr:DUF6663 family protein [Halorubrum vacuolatum]SNR34823.1 hypothetical protein SAMN06264855_10347 [Halorubrum vacuolatum]
MQPTTTGRFRVHDRRPRPDVAEATEEFVLVEIPPDPIDPNAPESADAFDPIFVTAEGYDGDLEATIDALAPGVVIDGTLAWDDGTARFTEVETVREDRFRFAGNIEGIFEAAVEAWNAIRADGEAFGSVTTRSTDGEPNGALYLFADGPGGDTFAELRAGRIPIEPLVARVNERLDDDRPREVFVLRPADHPFVLVHVVFDRDGVLARTIRDTYDLGSGLAAGLDDGDEETAGDDGADDDGTVEDDADEDGSDDFDLRDRL